MTISPTTTSRADVPTDKPDRSARQLVTHLGRKIEVVADGALWTATIGGATAQVVVGDGVLTLLAAGDDETVGVAEQVLGSHLQRFGARDDLTVSWTRTATHLETGGAERQAGESSPA